MKTKAQESWRTRPLPTHAQTDWNRAPQSRLLRHKYCEYLDRMEDCGASSIRSFDDWLSVTYHK
jgi:hypothetical protein